MCLLLHAYCLTCLQSLLGVDRRKKLLEIVAKRDDLLRVFWQALMDTKQHLVAEMIQCKGQLLQDEHLCVSFSVSKT